MASLRRGGCHTGSLWGCRLVCAGARVRRCKTGLSHSVVGVWCVCIGVWSKFADPGPGCHRVVGGVIFRCVCMAAGSRIQDRAVVTQGNLLLCVGVRGLQIEERAVTEGVIAWWCHLMCDEWGFAVSVCLFLFWFVSCPEIYLWKQIYLVNWLETDCRKSLIHVHAIWGLCWYH